MNCEQVKHKWSTFLEGKCSEIEEQEIENHIQQCRDCHQMLDEALIVQEINMTHNEDEGKDVTQQPNNDPLSIPDTKKYRRMITKAKWKHRFSVILTLLSLFIFISFISFIFTALYFGVGGENSKDTIAPKVVQTYTHLTMPNVHVKGISSETGFFYRLNMHATIEKQIGDRYESIGQLNASLLFNRLSVQRHWADGDYDVNLFFVHPQTIIDDTHSSTDYHYNDYYLRKSELIHHKEELLDAMEILPEGTITEAALSFEQLYSLDEIYELLGDYKDVNIVWYAINTGEEGIISNNRSPYLSTMDDIFGFNLNVVINYMDNDGSVSLRGDSELKADAFIDALAFLAKNEHLVKQYYPFNRREPLLLSKRHQHVVSHGVNSYGIVVTGPTKHILQIGALEEITYVTIGDVQLWNMYPRHSSGSISY